MRRSLTSGRGTHNRSFYSDCSTLSLRGHLILNNLFRPPFIIEVDPPRADNPFTREFVTVLRQILYRHIGYFKAEFVVKPELYRNSDRVNFNILPRYVI